EQSPRSKTFEERTVADASHAESHEEPNIWEHMTPAIQSELKADDSLAWNQVVGLLILIISIGLVLAVGTALFSGVLSVHL
ncbi:MAG TPA: hypothetical protein VKH44_02260, partial [Pirellulaceae bacterium]|nr:hypothetical protein [Pirellulaceae bacterium]